MNWLFTRITLFRLHCTMLRWALTGGFRLAAGRFFVLRDAPFTVLIYFYDENNKGTELFDRFQQAAYEELKLRIPRMTRAVADGNVEALLNELSGK